MEMKMIIFLLSIIATELGFMIYGWFFYDGGDDAEQ